MTTVSELIADCMTVLRRRAATAARRVRALSRATWAATVANLVTGALWPRGPVAHLVVVFGFALLTAALVAALVALLLARRELRLARSMLRGRA